MMMRKNEKVIPVALWLAGILILLAFPAAAPSSAQDQSCVTSRCHASMGKGKVVHSPVKDGMCSMCHMAVEEPDKKTKHPNKLSITLTAQGADLCAMCHEAKNTKKVVHAPSQGGDCTSCHDPHQSPHPAMMKQEVPKLCFMCHQDTMMKQKVMHMPVQGGSCSNCHDNHQSDYAGRLVEDGNALCYMCHADKAEAVKTKKTVHPPVQQACILCHNQHGSEHAKLMRDPVPAICSNCHPNQTDLAERAIVKHGPMAGAGSCMSCHDPHVADQPRLLTMAQRDLCLGCHAMEMETKGGKIKDMMTFLANNPNGHGPIKSDDCVSCHNPHGSDYWRILVRYYPREFYTAYSDGKYALCFGCHSSEAFTERKTKKATSFRDGDNNLHYLHVNKIAKGRTCRACHEEHADTGKPKHVKDAIDFGGWKMPIQFLPGPNGGSCAPGCHGEKRYSR